MSTSPLRLCVDRDSDSDSDLSLEDDQSGSYASTHSSDSEDEEGPLPPDECWENLASNVGKRPQPHGKEAPLSVVCASHILFSCTFKSHCLASDFIQIFNTFCWSEGIS